MILGGAANVHEDLEAARALVTEYDVVTVNHFGISYPGKINHWVTIHSEFMFFWQDARARQGLPPAERIWFAEKSPEVHISHSVATDHGGSSGLMAVMVALALSYDKIVLCGVPIEGAQAHFLIPEAEWQGAERYQRAWQRLVPVMADRVRSMSGWTARLLGQPDDVWLNIDRESASGTQSNS